MVSLLNVHSTAWKINTMLYKHPVVGPDLREKGKIGCFLSFANHNDEEMLGTLVGGYPPHDFVTYQRFAREKVSRTLRNYLTLGHVLSRQSANEELELYPGAAIGKQYIAGVSGYPSHVDELFALALLYQTGDLMYRQVMEILRIYPNKYYCEDWPASRALFQPI